MMDDLKLTNGSHIPYPYNPYSPYYPYLPMPCPYRIQIQPGKLTFFNSHPSSLQAFFFALEPCLTDQACIALPAATFSLLAAAAWTSLPVARWRHPSCLCIVYCNLTLPFLKRPPTPNHTIHHSLHYCTCRPPTPCCRARKVKIWLSPGSYSTIGGADMHSRLFHSTWTHRAPILHRFCVLHISGKEM